MIVWCKEPRHHSKRTQMHGSRSEQLDDDRIFSRQARRVKPEICLAFTHLQPLDEIVIHRRESMFSIQATRIDLAEVHDQPRQQLSIRPSQLTKPRNQLSVRASTNLAAPNVRHCIHNQPPKKTEVFVYHELFRAFERAAVARSRARTRKQTTSPAQADTTLARATNTSACDRRASCHQARL